MKILGLQYNKIQGPDVSRSYKIEFTIDESQAPSLKDFFDIKKGTEFIAILYNADSEEVEAMGEENEKDRRNRFMKRLYSIMREISKERNMTEKEVKIKVKSFLVKKNLIKESLSELDDKGLAKAIYYLESEK